MIEIEFKFDRTSKNYHVYSGANGASGVFYLDREKVSGKPPAKIMVSVDLIDGQAAG